MSRRSLFAVCVLLAIVACCAELALVDVRAAARAADSPGYWGFDTANLDKTCKPCDDFFQFAMGGWMKSNPIPPEYSTWGSFTVLADKNQQALRQILEAAEKSDAPAGSNERKVGDFYTSCMDTAAIEAAGTKPIDATLQSIGEAKNAGELQILAARLQQQGVGMMFRFTSNQDAKDSTQVIATALQGGLGLPERDYYLRDDDKSKKLREDYGKHVAKMFGLLGDSPEKAETEAMTVVKLETSLAKASMSNVDLRDPNKTYHKMKIAELQSLTPDFSWDSYLKTAGHAD
jgi:putative endopeptidase